MKSCSFSYLQCQKLFVSLSYSTLQQPHYVKERALSALVIAAVPNGSNPLTHDDAFGLLSLGAVKQKGENKQLLIEFKCVELNYVEEVDPLTPTCPLVN